MARRRRLPAKPGNGGASPRRRRWVWVTVGTVAVAATITLAVAVGTESSRPTGGTGDPAAVAGGAELFAASCAQCHGADLRGTSTGPPFLNVIYAPNHHSDEAFQLAVARGVVPHHWDFGPMAPVAGLTREDVALIIEYVRSEQEAAGILVDPSH